MFTREHLDKSIEVAMRYAKQGHAFGVVSIGPDTLAAWESLLADAALGAAAKQQQKILAIATKRAVAPCEED